MVNNEVNTFLGGFIAGVSFYTLVFFTSKLVACLKRNRVAVAPREFSTENEYILTLLVRSDIPLVKSKLAGHCAHASVLAFDSLLTEDPQAARFWMSTGQTKILVAAESVHVINRLEDLAKRLNLVTTFVCDERRSLVGPTTVTVFGIGPGPQNVVNRITHDLRIL